MRCARFSRLGFVSILLSCTINCSGGGEDDPAPAPPPNNTVYPLQAAYKRRIIVGETTGYRLSGSCSGFVAVEVELAKPAQFEGIDGFVSAETDTVDFTSPDCTSGQVLKFFYFDSNYIPLGFVETVPTSRFSEFTTLPSSLPTGVKVGDGALYATQSTFTDGSKSTVTGRRELSYVIENNGSPLNGTFYAIANLITRTFDTSNQLLSTEQARYLIGIDGTLKAISIDVTTSDGTHFVYTAI